MLNMWNNMGGEWVNQLYGKLLGMPSACETGDYRPVQYI